MRCPECRFEIDTLPCPDCAEREVRFERARVQRAKDYCLTKGMPTNESDIASLREAERQIRIHLKKAGFKDRLKYEPSHLYQAPKWWYIPYTWIGCFGFFVDKESGFVNWLGSGLDPYMDLCFWGQDHGLHEDAAQDFTFTRWANMEVVRSIVQSFRYRGNGRDKYWSRRRPEKWVAYKPEELNAAIQRQFPTFRNHITVYAFKKIREAYERGEIDFTTAPTHRYRYRYIETRHKKAFARKPTEPRRVRRGFKCRERNVF